MRNWLIILGFTLMPGLSMAQENSVKLDSVKIDHDDKPSLQRGAKLFVNYCLSCHSAAYMRYNRMAKDLDIPKRLVEQYMMFTADKIGGLMKSNMPPEEAKRAFGTVPPDLTLIARSRTPEWIYTYLRSFYRDKTSPSGWNNIVFPQVAMPFILYRLQGVQSAVFDKDKTTGARRFDKFELIQKGTMTPQEYAVAMRDLTNYLAYMAEPAKIVRHHIGRYAMVFLGLLLVLVVLLKHEYWRDVK